MALPLVFVDPVGGNDLNSGDRGAPVLTLANAYTKVLQGGTVLVTTTGNVGALTFSDSALRIKALSGVTATAGAITGTDASLIVEGIRLPDGVSISNSVVSGVALFRGCLFDTTSGIDLSKVKYVTVNRNKFDACAIGVLVTEAEEVGIGANIISDVATPVQIVGSKRLDFYHNTVDNCGQLFFDDFASGVSFNVVYVTVTPAIITAKQVSVGGVPISVAINVTSGTSQEEGVDFTVSGNTIQWSGLGMETDLEAGDVLRILYEAQGGIGSADRMRLDSNSLTQNAGGISFTSGAYVEVTSNNLWGTPITGGNLVGNINVDPLYEVGQDFDLQVGSPNISQANSTRWLDAFLETAPYDLNMDYTGANLSYVTGAPLSDMGSREQLDGTRVRSSSDISVSAQGFDSIGSGDPSKPFSSLGKAFQDASGDPIVVQTAGTTGVGFFRTYVQEGSIAMAGASALGATGGTLNEVVLRPAPDAVASYSGLYVSETGSDTTGDGSLGAPYRTIDFALTQGSSVLVLPGRYDYFTGVVGKSVTPVGQLLSWGQGFVVADVSSYTWDITESSGATGINTRVSMSLKHY